MTFFEKLRRSCQAAVATSLTDLFWYGLLACTVWICFHYLLRRAMARRSLMRHEATRGQIAREIIHSVRSIAIFGLVTAAVVFAVISGWTRVYVTIERFGWVWFVCSIGVMIVLHDAYFYWTHRLMHHRRLYRLFHKTHHLSTSPTPWAAYAFSPLEALVQAGIGPLIIFTIPVHPLAFATFMMWQITFNVLGHSGYEIFPRWLLSSRLGLFINSITHHAQHHEKFRANYGLYFNFWDRLMGTNHREYEQRFAEVTAEHKSAPSVSGLRSARYSTAHRTEVPCANSSSR